METQRIALWCQLLGKRVEVVLGQKPRATSHPGIPEGWDVESCLGRDTDCYTQGCPFTVEEDVQDGMPWPFSANQPR